MIDRDTSAHGVLLIGHGTRDDEGTSQFFQLASRLAELISPQPLEPALLEFQSPTIPQAWDALLARGVQAICAAPLLLFAAGHAKQDIPSVLAECRSRTPWIHLDHARPISRHPAMIRLSQLRLQESMSRSSSHAARTAVVMVGRGSHDPCAQADMRVLAEIVGHRALAAYVTTAFYAMAEPRVPSVLDELAGSGRFDTIVVQPHLLFAGRLFQAILNLVREASIRHPPIQWLHSDYLGPDQLVAQAIQDRCIDGAGAFEFQ